MTEDETPDVGANSVEMEFVKGHIAATMVLIQGLMQQGRIDAAELDSFFTRYLDSLPNKRSTLPLRLIIDQWREGIRQEDGEDKLRRHILSVVDSPPKEP